MLTPRQTQLVAALLTRPTVRAACKKARVSVRSYNEWAHQPEFRDAVRAAGREAVERAGVALQGLCARAVATLGRGMRGKATPAAIKAAVAVLDRAGQAATVAELLGRIEALERAQPCRPAFTSSRNGSLH
jgi:hypothetical protein